MRQRTISAALTVIAVLSLATWAWLAALPHWGSDCTRFLAGYGFLFLLYAAAVAMVRGRWPSRRSLTIVWVTAVIMRGIVVLEPLSLSDDLYRYIWDGRVLLDGINPYRYAPADSALSHLRDGLWPLINNRSLPTIYPPVLMFVFAGAAAVAPTVLGFKLVFVVFDLLAGVFLQRALGEERAGLVVAYLWAPLVLVEFAGQGHADVVGITLLAAALWATMNARWFSTGVLIVLASLVKFGPLAALPALVHRLGIRWLALPVLFVGLYLPFHQGDVNAIGSLGTFAAKWRSNDFLFSFLHEPTVPTEIGLAAAKRTAALIVAGVWVLVVLLRRPWYSVYSWTIGTALLLSPVVHPWYVLWLLPAALFVPHVAWWVWSGTVILAYAALPGFIETGIWTESATLKWVEYLPVLILLPVQAIMELRAATRPPPRLPIAGF